MKLNNHERKLWIDNNEYLYNLKKFSGLSVKNFIKENKELIDGIIRNAIG